MVERILFKQIRNGVPLSIILKLGGRTSSHTVFLIAGMIPMNNKIHLKWVQQFH